VVTAVGRDKAGTVEMLIDAVVNHAANIEIKLPKS
jgi:glycine cleavage system regulatory protein